jgi:23S rRNA (uracil1939-C5)-methyltransferase
MHAPGRFDRIVDLERCELVSDAMNRVLARVREDALGSEWSLWDASATTRPDAPIGFWRHLVLREGEAGVLASIHTSRADAAQAEWLRARAPGWGAAGVLWYVNETAGDAAIGTLEAVLWGDAILRETLGAIRFELSPTAFFQVNAEGARVLCATVAEAAGSGDTLLDLYCGTGALGLTSAGGFRRVIGIDSNVASITDARANATRNGVAAEFHAGDVEAIVTELYSGLALPAPPVVIIDPPRVGLHPKALAFVSGLEAQCLVYVACRPTSLLRDGMRLMEAGWSCTDRWAIDLFPQTGHVEIVSRWVRASEA